jgi:hypothetical protein
LKEKLGLSLIMVMFYSFSNAIYSEETYLKSRELLLANMVLRKKIEQMYPKRKYPEIIKELIIDREIKTACSDLVFDDQLLKIKFLSKLTFNEE